MVPEENPRPQGGLQQPNEVNPFRTRVKQANNVLIGLSIAAFVLSGIWLYFSPSFEPLISLVASLFALVEFVSLSQKKWKIASITLAMFIVSGGAVYALQYFNILDFPGFRSSSEVINLNVRVADNEGDPVSGADVLLFSEGPPIKQITDSNGNVAFTASAVRTEVQIVVQTQTYRAYEETTSLRTNRTINVRLEDRDSNSKSILIRAIDNVTNEQIAGAEVVLTLNGDVLSDVTDSNGFAIFSVELEADEARVDLQITTDSYEVNRQTITLRPDVVQDVSLDATRQQIAAVDTTQSRIASRVPLPMEGGSGGFDPDSESIVSELITTLTEEQEENNSAEQAQIIQDIGVENPVQAMVVTSRDAESADADWYKFLAIAGSTYVVEIFDVGNTLGLSSRRYNCGEGTRDHAGLRLTIYTPLPELNEIAKQCTPSGRGNTHTSAEFTAGVSGEHFIQIVPHSLNVAGNYKVRILPQYDEPLALWDPVSFEPNDTLSTAFEIFPGLSNSLSSRIGARNNAFSTSASDKDFYRFEVLAGDSYVVELFDVSTTLSAASVRYNCGEGTRDHSGLFLKIIDPFGNEVKRQCTPRGAGDVHTTLEFTAGASDTYFIEVVPHERSVAGEYSLRILPQFDRAGSIWNDLFEPNNQAFNAFLIQPGSENALDSRIETRSATFSTNRADRDWFYINAEAGKTYRIELSNVESGLELLTNRYNCGEGIRNHTGLWLGVFDPSINEVARQCSPNGEGTVRSFVEFTASVSNVYYILTYPHEQTLSGDYTIRVTSD